MCRDMRRDMCRNMCTITCRELLLVSFIFSVTADARVAAGRVELRTRTTACRAAWCRTSKMPGLLYNQIFDNNKNECVTMACLELMRE